MGTSKTILMSRWTLGSAILVFLVCAYFSGATNAAEQEVDFEFDDGAADVRIVKRSTDITDDEDFLNDEPGSGYYEGSGTEEPPVITTLRPPVDPYTQRFYRVSINISSLTWNPELGDRNSAAFAALAAMLTRDLEQLYKNQPGEQMVTVLSFSKGSVIVTFDLGATGDLTEEQLMNILKDTIAKGMLGDNRVSLEGFGFKPLDAPTRTSLRCSLRQLACTRSNQCISRTLACNGYKDCKHGEDEVGCSQVLCPDFIGRAPNVLPGGGNNFLNLLVNNAFPCEGNINGWEYYRTSAYGSAYVSVWRQVTDSEFTLIKKTELPPAPVGVTEVQLRDPIQVRQGDFIGILFPRNLPQNFIGTSMQNDGAVPTSELYQNYQLQIFNEDIGEGETIDLNKMSFTALNTTFAIRALMDYYDTTSGVGPDATPLYTCKPNEYSCGDGYCIQGEYRCDNQRDCPNGEDEEGCPASTEEPESCLEGRFRCNDGTCVDRSLRCDGVPDCPDGSDELCTQCANDEFTCNSGECIPLFVKCNGVDNCQDGSDESECPQECYLGEFTCADGSCIPAQLECDNRADCPDGSDEFNCKACNADDFVCKDGSCIPMSLKCDAFPDCPDNSDEESDMCLEVIPTVPPSCPDGFFRCDSGICLDEKERCDGKIDCFNGSDERDCEEKKCKDDEFRCNNGDCIRASLQCDSFPDCADLSDEIDCGISISGPSDEVRLGDRVRISCNASGPYGFPSHIHWFRNGTNLTQEAFNQRRYYRINDFIQRRDGYYLTELDIFRAALTDSGIYTCRVSPLRSDSLKVTVVKKACTNQEFTCRSTGRCVDLRRRCDGRMDCRDRSDEYDCKCTDGEFRCEDGLCIPLEKKCNGAVDCRRGSDERNCTCSAAQFQCTSGQCIDARRRCDRRRDCFDGSDETRCRSQVACRSDEFSCSNARECVDATKRCDGVSDCDDRSDEIGCPCRSDQFTCDDGKCIPDSLKCNGKPECEDGSDEKDCGCSVSEYECANGQCVSYTGLCDGVDDCDDGSDEVGCAKCRSDEFECAEGTCVPEAYKCDRYVQCPDASDETSCTCSSTEMACANGQCIPATSSCDGRRDCFDGSDETLCEPTKRACTTSEFMCGNGDCIESFRRCDRRRDCDDGTDEIECPTCFSDEFECGDSTCIDIDQRCDREVQCRDGSDEAQCDCSPNDYKCGNGQCVKADASCDGVADCFDGSDEFNCAPRCTSDQFTCDNGECIDLRRKCNGVPDCADSSDENECRRRCGEEFFQCDTGHCLPIGRRCDGREDCPNGSDERECPTCSPEEFTCVSSGQCIRMSQRCDDKRDCDDSSDERDCPCQSDEFTCVSDGRCLPPGYRCNGNSDCRDGSDETDCPRDCYEYEFRCTNGQCISADQRCDRRSDCADGSDERDCDPDIHLLINPDQLRVREGQTAVFECSGFYGDKSLVEWIRRTGGSMPATAVVENGRLTIPNCRPEYAGDYTCRVTVDIADAKTEVTARLTVDVGQPQISLSVTPQQLRVRAGMSALFVCSVNGGAPSRLEWIRRTGGAMPFQATQDGTGRLSIPTAQPQDAGDYTCRYQVGDRYVEAFARLGVDYIGPLSTARPDPSGPCGRDESTCSNGQCVPKDYICDGEDDCTDGSDEKNCSTSLPCEPNEFRCNNGRCALKIWRCDGDDDCFDGSDETNCPTSAPGAACRYDEFSCRAGDQCIPFSYQCDGEVDCQDRSDEIGCSEPSIVTPPQPEITVEVNGTFTIICEAVGVPTPLIVWRLNWGNIPTGPRVSVTSVGGKGTLRVTNALPTDAGAYTCEAINNRGSIFAIPDALIIVRGTKQCQSPYFNSEAVSRDECVRCFCFGRTQTCYSSTLQMSQITLGNSVELVRRTSLEPTERGFVQYIPASGEFEVKDFNRVLRTGSYYWSLPYQYLSKRLSSYGGTLNYDVLYEVDGFDVPTDDPDVILIGNGITLFHRREEAFKPDSATTVSVPLFEKSWERSRDNRLDSSSISDYASREDLMLLLDNVTSILIRATYDNKQSYIKLGNVLLTSGVVQNTGLGRAVYVEECACPTGYTGFSCEECDNGFYNLRRGRYQRECTACNCNGHSNDCDSITGMCKSCRDNTVGASCNECAPGYFGDPTSGRPDACQPCPCPLTNPENQFSPTCRLDNDGQVTCQSCPVGYIGRRCERCDDGYRGDPTVVGDFCKPIEEVDVCDPRGSIVGVAPNNGVCTCKNNVQGKTCNECNRNTFYLMDRNPDGCISCFCMGVTQTCQSTTSNRSQVVIAFTNSPSGVHLTDPLRKQKYEDNSRVDSQSRELIYRVSPTGGDDQATHWNLPDEFLGDKVSSYGGNLRFTLRYTAARDTRPDLRTPLVEIGGNDITFVYRARGNFPSGRQRSFSIPLIESSWYRMSGERATREHLMMALADLDYIMIKATFGDNMEETAISSISLDIAENRNTGLERAYSVEQCSCPRGYKGLSCEDCATGYTRTGGGLYLGLCQPCQCNGHSSTCDPETGVCRNCRHNTYGDKCEKCGRGFYGDATRGSVNDCQACPCPLTQAPNQFSPECYLESDNQVTCSACPAGHEGRRCERCAPGYQGNPMKPNDFCKLINVTCDCDVRGTVPNTLCNFETKTCQCKHNAMGSRCSSCRDGHFHLSRDNQQGCLKCYCSGVSSQCTSSNYYRQEVIPMFNADGSHNFVLTNRRLRTSISDGFTINAEDNEITFSNFDGVQRERESLYMQLPPKFRGDKVTSYGGYLRFGISYTAFDNGGKDYPDVDVEIISKRDKRLYHLFRPSPKSRNSYTYDIKLVESSFRNVMDGDYPSREDFMYVLSDIDAILIRATYHSAMDSITLRDVRMDIAVPAQTSMGSAPEVEMCTCPEGYAGLSCQECAAGYLKVDSDEGPRCMKCNCNGHANSCDPNTGDCLNCQHNTEGKRCQSCARGYYGDPTAGTPDDCRVCPCPLTIPSNQFSPTCFLDTDNQVTCDRCPAGYTGRDCGTCADGYRGNPKQPRGRCEPDDGPRPTVLVTPTSVTEPLGSTVTFQCAPQGRGPFNVVWSRLDGRPLPGRASTGPGPNYLLTITELEYADSARYVCTVSSARGSSQGYVILKVNPIETQLRIRIEEPTTLVLEPGSPARLICVAVEYSSAANYVLSWSKDGGQLPAKAIDQYGVLVIPDIEESDLGTYRCTGSDPISTDTATAVIQFGDFPKAPTVRIEPRYLQVKVGERVEFRCIAEGNPKPIVKWTKGESDPLPSYVETDDNGLLRIASVTIDDQSEYYCSANNAEGGASVRTIIYVSRPTRVIEVVTRRATITAVVGSTEQITCYAQPAGAATLAWTREGGLPIGSSQLNGVLTLSNIQRSFAGNYICTGSTASGIIGRSTVRVTVTGEIVERPTARIEPERQTVSSGTTGTLRCIVTGTPLPTITWSRSRGNLSANHQVNGNILRITQASMDDRDIYVCLAENRGGYSQASAMVDIERRESPEIEIYPNVQQTRTVGSSAMFQCRIVGGIPAPTITWSRAGSRAMTSRTTVKQENGVIMFVGITSEEQGEYICSATNAVGTISATASIRVDGPPAIEITPGNRIVTVVGERVDVECVGIGSPTPNVVWESTQRRRSDVLPDSFAVAPGVATLSFESIEKRNEGRYICIAANEKGSVTEAVDIVVNTTGTVTPGVKIDGPESITAVLGQSVTLTCSAQGVPNPRIRWRRPGGLALPPNHSVRNGALYIPSLEEEYTGEYICTVSSEIIPTVFTASVYIIVRVTPKITVSPQRLTVETTQPIQLRCQPNGQGPFTIEWTRVGGSISPQARENNGILEIRQATRADSGRYRCTVRNSAGTTEAYADVIVIAPPVVTVTPQQNTVTVGATVVMECTIYGDVQAQIRWEKVGGELPLQHEIKAGRLTLYNVQEADTGRYMCTASNEVGFDRKMGYLRVESGAVVTPGTPVQTFEVGDKVEFECVVKDAGKSTMTWVKKEGPLPASAIIGGRFLIIPEARQEDSGTYQCTATNEAGSVRSEVKLLVQGRPTVGPINKEYTTASLGSPAQLHCEASGSPQPRISWIKEDGDLPDDHTIVEGGDLYIPRVTEEDAGKYNCLASSVYGTSRYPVVLVVGSLVPYFQQNPTSYMSFNTLKAAYLDTDIRMTFRPEATDGLILYNGQYATGSGDYLCFGMREAYPEFRFDVGAGPAVIRGDRRLELNKWHTIQLKRDKKQGTLLVNDEPVYSGEAPGVFQGLDLAQPLYIGSVPDFAILPRGASFNTGFVGGISQVELQGENLNLGKSARDIVGVEAYPVCDNSDCENGALCQPANNYKGYVCNCKQGYAGERCEVLGQKCYPGACGSEGRCIDLPNGQTFACICPIGFSGEGCVLGLSIVDPAFNKTSFISYPTIKDGVISVRIEVMFKPRSLDDSVILYNAQRMDGKQDFIALIIKDKHLEFRFDTGSGPAILRSRYPLTVDAWTMVKADRKGRDGMLTIDQEEAVNEYSAPVYNNLFPTLERGDVQGGFTSGTGTVGLNLERPLFLGGIDPEETINPNTGASDGFVGCIGELTINGQTLDLIKDASESVNIQDCGDRSLCSRNPCQNGGQCEDVSPTEYRCDCPEQFAGQDCEIEMNICVTSQPCLNEGNCMVTDSGSFECQCKLGFMGRTCETAIELGTSVEFMKDGYAEFPRKILPHRRRQTTERIKMSISTLEEQSALLFWQGQNPGEQSGKDYLSISINDGYLEFRYELGSGPAVIRSARRVNDGFKHVIVAERLGRAGSLTVDDQPSINGTSKGPLQVLNVQGNIFFGGVPDLSAYTSGLFTKNYEGCVSEIQLMGAEPALDFKTSPLGGMNVQPCVNN